MKTNDYKCIFSVVIAVYNCEPFLRETLDSIVNQNIDGMVRYENGEPTDIPLSFEEICEVIMVDDGSTDGSGDICDEYAAKYPNFLAVHKPNGGVASARNEGMLHIRGKYMNFLDSDDKFSDNVFREIYKYYEVNYDKTDVVTMPLQFFDAASGPHWQNYKFKKHARLVNLYNEYDSPLMFVNASFFKSEYKDRVSFCGKLVCGEDIRFICEILADKMTMGLVPYCRYDYRRRSAGEESLVQTSKKKLGWYFDYFEYLTEWAVDFCRERWGYMPHYYQHIIVCDLQWRFLGNYELTALSVLGEEMYLEYKKRLFSVLRNFDDKIILGQRNIHNEHKCMMLTKKHGKAPEYCVYSDDVRLRFGNTLFCWLSSCYSLINTVKIDKGILTLEGYTTLLGYSKNDSVEVVIEVTSNGSPKPTVIPCSATVNRDASTKALDEELYHAFSFIFNLDIKELADAKINLVCYLNRLRIVKKDIRFGRFSPITKNYKNSYYFKDGYTVKLDGYTFSVKKCSAAKARAHSLAFIKELAKSKKKSDKKAFLAIICAKFLKLFKKKKIWLISDREELAGDNGEALFEYLSKNKPKNTDVYFVVSSDSRDFERMAAIGKVLGAGTRSHKMKYLLADMIIMSHTDDGLIIPFKEYSAPYLSFIADKKYIFLQHGVTINDVSRWFNKYSIGASGFITSSPAERSSILNGKYCYSEDAVWLTGMPRFDRLRDETKKIIAVLPTWRAYLLTSNGNSPLSESKFASSAYFSFYKRLFSDERLKAALDKHGYEMIMKPHFRMSPYLDLFSGSEKFKVFPEVTDYRTIFSESALLLTDYSSASFDFSYLRKPVLYSQFDKDEFFSGLHTYTPGYFDYERDGFGEVTTTLDETVDLIIEYMENGCKLKDKYRERIDNFFAYNDKNNCQRIFDHIVNQ